MTVWVKQAQAGSSTDWHRHPGSPARDVSLYLRRPAVVLEPFVLVLCFFVEPCFHLV